MMDSAAQRRSGSVRGDVVLESPPFHFNKQAAIE